MDTLESEIDFCKKIETSYTNNFLPNQRINWLINIIEQVNIFICANNLNLSICSKKTANLRKKFRTLLQEQSDHAIEPPHYGKPFKLVKRYNLPYVLLTLFQTYSMIGIVMAILLCRSRLFERFAISSMDPTLESKAIFCHKFIDLDQLRRSDINHTKNSYFKPIAQDTATGVIVVNSSHEFIIQRYKGFCLWQAREFNSEFWRFSFMLVANDFMSFVYSQSWPSIAVIASFTVGSIVGTLALEYLEVDLPLLLFLYDPKFAVSVLHHRLTSYLRMLNVSFAERESKDEIGYRRASSTRDYLSENSLFEQITTEEKLLDRRWSRNENCEPCLMSLKHFDSYVPITRYQQWRKILVLFHSFSMPCFGICGASSALVVCIYVYLCNSETVDLNRDIISNLVNHKGSQSGIEFVNYMYDLITTNISHSYLTPEWFKQNLTINEKASLIGHILSPSSIPGETFLVWPLIMILLNVIVFWSATILSLLLVSLIDLVIWVIMLQMKLNICILLMRYYELNGGFIRQRLELAADDCYPPLSPNFNIANNLMSDDESTIEDQSIFFGGSESFSHQMSGFSSFRRRCSVRPSTDLGSMDIALTSMMKHQRRDKRTSPSHPRSERKDSNKFEFDLNICPWDIINFLMVNESSRERISTIYANRIIKLDRNCKSCTESVADRFMVSTYLDFRLFRDHIEQSKLTLRLAIVFGVLQAPIILGCLIVTLDFTQKLYCLTLTTLAQLFTLFPIGLLQSHSSKLSRPILSLLALTVRGDRKIQFIAMLWRRSIADLYGPKCLFTTRFFSITVSYATSLEVSKLYTNFYTNNACPDIN